MAKNEENYNTSVLGYLDSIENDKLDRITYAVERFVKAYNSKILNEQRESSKKQAETINVLKGTEKSRKADAVKTETLMKHTAKNSDLQAKTLEKILENSLDAKNAQETLQKIQESSVASMKSTNQEIIKGLSELSSSAAENAKTSDKLYSLTENIQQENMQARLQGMLKDTKRFRLESNYWKSFDAGIKGMVSEFKDFKNNPERYLADALGQALGKGLDKTVDGLKKSMDSIAKGITDGLGNAVDGLFKAISDLREQSETVAAEVNISYKDAKENADSISAAISNLYKSNKAAAYYATQHSDKILYDITKNFRDFKESMSPEQLEKLIATLGVAHERNIDVRSVFERFDKLEDIQDVLSTLVNQESALKNLGSEKQESTARALMFDWKDQTLRMSEKQLITINKTLAPVAATLAKNKGINEQSMGMFRNAIEEMLRMTDVEKTIGKENVQTLQGIGYSTERITNIIKSGDAKQLIELMKAMKSLANLDEIPALKSLSLVDSNVWRQIGEIKYEKDENIEASFNRDWIDEANETLGDVKKAELEIQMSFRALQSMMSAPKDKQDEARRNFLLDSIHRQIQDTNLATSASEEKMTKMIDVLLKSDDISKASMDGLTKEENKVFEYLKKTGLNKAEEFIDDMGIVARQATLMEETGMAQALSSGGIQGMLTKIVSLTMDSTFTETRQKQLKELLSNLGKTIKPLFNVLKQVIIDPVITILKDNIGGLLGEISVFLKKRWPLSKDMTAEEEFIERNKFRTRTEYDEFGESKEISYTEFMAKELLKSRQDGSEQFKKAISELMSSKDINLDVVNTLAKKYRLKDEQVEQMSAYASLYKTGDVQTISNEETSKILAQNRISVSGQSNDDAKLFKDTLSMLVGVSKDSEQGHKDRRSFIEEQGLLNDEEKSRFNKIFKAVETIMSPWQSGLSKFFNIDQGAFWSAIDAVAFELAKNKNLRASITPNFVKWEKVGDDGIQIMHGIPGNYGWIQYKPVEYANGGVVAATKGGQRITVGEAGYDEIIIPTDPAKQQRAQELLALAQDKYGLYANSQDNIDEKLKEQMADLLLDLRILMIQLDPMRDVIAMQKVMQAFSMLKNIGNMNYLSGDVLNDSQSEKDAFFAQYDLSTSAVPRGDMPKQTEKEKLEYENALKELASWSGGKTEPEKFISMLGPIAREDMRCTKVPASVTIAQAIQETGWGKSAKPSYRNLFGIKAKKGDPTAHYVWTKENRGGTLQKEMAYFRSYNSYLESILDHSQFLLRNKRYENAFNFTFEPEKFAVAIHKAGYATSDHYSKDLIDHIRRRNLQERFDLKQGVVQGVDDSTKYDPALQSTPNASYVSDQVCRADQAKIEKERRTAERQNKAAMEQVTEVINNLGIKLTGMDMKRQKSVSVPNDKIFCTSGMSSSSVSNYCQG